MMEILTARCSHCGIYLRVPAGEEWLASVESCPACEAPGTMVSIVSEACRNLPFTAIVDFHYLAPQVVAVAQTRIEGAWKAYIDSVPPDCEDQTSVARVLERGTALPAEVARALFPRFSRLIYAR